MKLLALDTSSLACSVALQLGDEIIERYEEQAREHTRLLVPMIRSILEESAVSMSELDALVLGNGPGSFIGMRIAASVAQGLAHGAGLNIVPVSSMAAVAAEVFAESDADIVMVTQDAHMNEVYLGGYQRGQNDLPAEIFAERLHGQDGIAELAAHTDKTRVAAGAGWQRYPALLESNRLSIDAISECLNPRASFLLGLGAQSLGAGLAVAPAEIMPAYLRQKVAEKPAPTS